MCVHVEVCVHACMYVHRSVCICILWDGWIMCCPGRFSGVPEITRLGNFWEEGEAFIAIRGDC